MELILLVMRLTRLELQVVCVSCQVRMQGFRASCRTVRLQQSPPSMQCFSSFRAWLECWTWRAELAGLRLAWAASPAWDMTCAARACLWVGASHGLTSQLPTSSSRRLEPVWMASARPRAPSSPNGLPRNRNTCSPSWTSC